MTGDHASSTRACSILAHVQRVRESACRGLWRRILGLANNGLEPLDPRSVEPIERGVMDCPFLGTVDKGIAGVRKAIIFNESLDWDEALAEAARLAARLKL